MSPTDPKRVLVVGAYFTDRVSRIGEIRNQFDRSENWQVEQRWVALGDRIPPGLEEVTVALTPGAPKFTLVNRELGKVDLRRYSFVIVCDDDITLPRHFLDEYLALVEEFGFALAQPARTHDSYTDHHFVSQLLGIRARQTRFVEIGPLFSMRADILSLLTPFDEQSAMGWGYDFIWPVILARAQRTMGIIDACPVGHTLRKPVTSYSRELATAQMAALLAQPHLEPLDAFHIVKSYL